MFRNIGEDLFQLSQSLRETQELLLSHVEKLERQNEELRKDLSRRENINAILAEEIRDLQAEIDRMASKNRKDSEHWQSILKRYLKEIEVLKK